VRVQAKAAELAAAREEALSREAVRRRADRQAHCAHPNSVTDTEEHVYPAGGGEMEEITLWIVRCASCGKELKTMRARTYTRPMMPNERQSYRGA
jgi:hypothetical protein